MTTLKVCTCAYKWVGKCQLHNSFVSTHFRCLSLLASIYIARFSNNNIITLAHEVTTNYNGFIAALAYWIFLLCIKKRCSLHQTHTHTLDRFVCHTLLVHASMQKKKNYCFSVSLRVETAVWFPPVKLPYCYMYLATSVSTIHSCRWSFSHLNL